MGFTAGSTLFAPGQENLTGSVLQLLPKVYGTMFQTAYKYQKYLNPGFFARVPVNGFNTKTNELMGTIGPKLWSRGYNYLVNVSGGGGPEVMQAPRRDNLLSRVDDEPWIFAENWTEYDRRMSPDGGVGWVGQKLDQHSDGMARINDFCGISALLQTASISLEKKPASDVSSGSWWGGGKLSRVAAGTQVWGASAAADLANGLIVDASGIASSNRIARGAALEEHIGYMNQYFNTLNAPRPRILLVSESLANDWLHAQGGLTALTAAANFVPARALNRDYSDGSAGDYAKGVIGTYRGFQIVTTPLLDSLGDQMDSFFPSTLLGATGSKYAPGSSYTSTTLNLMSVAKIAGYDNDSGNAFDQNNSGAKNTAWDNSGSALNYTKNAFNKVRAIAFVPGAVEELPLFEPTGMLRQHDEMLGGWTAVSFAMGGFGPKNPYGVMYLATGKG